MHTLFHLPFRLATAAIGLLALGLTPAISVGEVLWKSEFETVNSVAVTHGQNADTDPEPDPDPQTSPEPDAVDSTGTTLQFGEADGSQDPFTILPPYLYKKYGVGGVPTIPGALDPTGAAGATAFYFANEHRAGINTELPTGNVAGLPYNLNAATTVEGYFNTAYTDVINYQTTVPVRLYSDMRTYQDGALRLGVGISNYQPPPTDGLFDYEGFDYDSALLVGTAGGTGWKAGSQWTLTASGETASAISPVLSGSAGLDYSGLTFAAPLTPPAPIGKKIDSGGGSGPSVAERLMKVPYDMGAEGKVLWISCLMRKGSTSSTSSESVYLRFFDNTYNLRLMLALSSAERCSIIVGTGAQVNSNAAQSIVANRTYLVLAKVVSHAGTNDEGAMWVFDATPTSGLSGSTIPATEAGLPSPVHLGVSGARSDGWVANGNTNAILDRVHVRVDQNNNTGQIDELRIGSTYESVVTANPPIGEAPAPYNVLGMFYVNSAGSAIPVYGTTPVLGNTWYHFAAVYDGSQPAANRTLTAYLNGQPEISVQGVTLANAGTAPIVIGNDRFQAEIDVRNWYGLMDQVRVYDKVLAPSDLMVNGPPHADHLIWASNFETDKGQATIHDQEPATGIEIEPGDGRRGFVSSIDNSAAGGLGGYAVMPDLLRYLVYGQDGITPPPDTLDPFHQAGLAAFYFPVERSGRITTNLPSNAGNLASRLTYEGYFNSWDPTIQTATLTLARRLFSQRSAPTVTRLGMGLHRSATGNVLGVLYRSTSAHQAHGENAATQDHLFLDTVNVTPHQWYRAKLIYDGTTVVAYLNGVERLRFNPVDLAVPSADVILIGNGLPTNADHSHGFYGLMDRVEIRDDAAICPTPFADADGDKDVDQDDFAILQACLTGPGGTAQPGCVCFDRAPNDGDVDAADLDTFTKCVSGPAIEWQAALTPECAP